MKQPFIEMKQPFIEMKKIKTKDETKKDSSFSALLYFLEFLIQSNLNPGDSHSLRERERERERERKKDARRLASAVQRRRRRRRRRRGLRSFCLASV
jgi:hypothetical protein